MHFATSYDPWVIRSFVPEFISLLDAQLWERRITGLAAEAERSPFLGRITSDYHWLELQIAQESLKRTAQPAKTDEEIDPISRRAIAFCGGLVQTYRNLNALGQKVLRGRLTDALQAETGFASLYQEIELGSWLMSKGFEIEFPDLDGSGTGDIKFTKGLLVGHVECKSLSPDAGRKIHRKHFYRFMDALSHELLVREAIGGANEFLVITLKDRLSKDIQNQSRLLEAVLRLLRSKNPSSAHSDFTIERHDYAHWIGGLNGFSMEQFYEQVRQDFGQNSHLAGAQYGAGRCFILMRSRKPDDPSEPKLEVMEKAVEQLPKDRPGFISLQLGDISSADLALPHLRERLSLLTWYLFKTKPTKHIAAVQVTAYGALSVAADAVARFGIVIWNPEFRFSHQGLPFQGGATDEAFKIILNTSAERIGNNITQAPVSDRRPQWDKLVEDAEKLATKNKKPFSSKI